MDLFTESLIGKDVKITFTDSSTLYHQRIRMMIMDINGHPLSIKLENGGLINWASIIAITPQLTLKDQ